MGKVAWTREAERWLRTIFEHVAENDSDAAMRTVRGLLAKAQMLARFPKLGQRYPQHGKRHVRVLRYGHYRIAYAVETGSDVVVLGVFHERLDIKRFLDSGGAS